MLEFIAGFFIGGIIAVIVMCFLTVGGQSDNYKGDKAE